MSTFDKAIGVILTHEGGWVSNPADPGGETNFGISTLIIKRENISNADLGLDPNTQRVPGWMKAMKVDAAKNIYKKLFWDKYGYEQFHDQLVATKIFDCSVNCGPSRAHRMAQLAANQCGQALSTDGIIGIHTIVGVNACSPDKWMEAMVIEMKAYYNAIALKNPALRVFLNNWNRRAAWIG